MAYLNRSEIIGNTGKPATIVHLQSDARSIAELNADSIQLLTPRNSIASGTPYASQPEQQQGAPADSFEGDDDLPF